MGIAFQQATAIRQMPELREAPETFEYSAESSGEQYLTSASQMST